MKTKSQLKSWKNYVYCEDCRNMGETAVVDEKGRYKKEPSCNHSTNFKLVRFWRYEKRVYFQRPCDKNIDGYCLHYKERT